MLAMTDARPSNDTSDASTLLLPAIITATAAATAVVTNTTSQDRFMMELPRQKVWSQTKDLTRCGEFT